MGGDVDLTREEAERLGPTVVAQRRHLLVLRAVPGTTRCALLHDGRCSQYEDRPHACREYPWYRIGSSLYYDAGCPGVGDGPDSRPAVSQITAAENYFRSLPGPVRALVLVVLTRW